MEEAHVCRVSAIPNSRGGSSVPKFLGPPIYAPRFDLDLPNCVRNVVYFNRVMHDPYLKDRGPSVTDFWNFLCVHTA